MATDYIKAIKQKQPNGPYYILGWSVGGKIAYEIVHQLIEHGDSIANLIMLDTSPKFIPRKNKSPLGLTLYIYGVISMFRHGQTIYKNLNITSVKVSNLCRRLRMWVKIIKAAYRYSPVNYSKNLKALLIQTNEGKNIELYLNDKSRSINSFIDNLKVIHIYGKHLEMLSEPYVQILCQIIKDYLKV